MWKKYRLSDIGTIVSGATPSTTVEKYYGGKIPWLTPKDLSSFNERYITKGERNITEDGLKSCSAQLLPKGSVLFSSRAPIGHVAIAVNPIATNQGFKSIIPNKDINSLFLYYVLKYNKTNIKSMGSGTTFKEVSVATMKNIEILLPPLEEQERIAGILGALDDKIELNNRINQNLEEQAAALFHHWFVDFEFPDSNGNPYRSSGGSFVDSLLGEIPTGWKVGKLSDYASHFSRGVAPKYADSGEEIILNQKCIRNHDVSFTESRLHTPNAINEKWLKFEDILINSTRQGTLGQVSQFFLNRNNVTVDSHVSIVRPVSSNYIYFLGQAIISREQEIESMASKSTGQTELPRERLNNMAIITPDLETIAKLNSITSQYFALKIPKRYENQILKELRDSLLSKLINNKI